MALEKISENKCFHGTQYIYQHHSEVTQTLMKFAIYIPESAKNQKLSTLWYLSGLTCTEENVTFKSGIQQHASNHDMIIIAPDTSPRGTDLEGEHDTYDFGSGAGFYINATQAPWKKHYRMFDYITEELQNLVIENFPVDKNKQAITGHSMGGHGAIMIGLRKPDIYKSISAFAPIVAPKQCDWGKKAFSGYLGSDVNEWNQYDSTELVKSGHSSQEILIDQGSIDDFLESQLKPQIFIDACKENNQRLTYNLREGYDHSYYFISTFIEGHIKFHSEALAT